jgi:hypothetical protein
MKQQTSYSRVNTEKDGSFDFIKSSENIVCQTQRGKI